MKIAYAIMKFSRLSVLSVIFHQEFSSGSNNFPSEKLRMIVLFNFEYGKAYGQERFCKICSHLYLFGKRCKLEVLNFKVKIQS